MSTSHRWEQECVVVEKVREGEKAREENQSGRRVDAFPNMCVCIDAMFVCTRGYVIDQRVRK